MNHRIQKKWLWGVFSVLLIILISLLKTERTDRDCFLKAKSQLSSTLKSTDLAKCLIFKGTQKRSDNLIFTWYKTWENTSDSIFVNIAISKSTFGENNFYYSGNQNIWEKLLIDDVKSKPVNSLTKHQLYLMEKYKKYRVCNNRI